MRIESPQGCFHQNYICSLNRARFLRLGVESGCERILYSCIWFLIVVLTNQFGGLTFSGLCSQLSCDALEPTNTGVLITRSVEIFPALDHPGPVAAISR